MSVIDYKTFSGKIREKLLLDISNDKILEKWFIRIIAIEYFQRNNLIKLKDYEKNEIIDIIKYQNDRFSEIFNNDIDELIINYPNHFYNDDMINLLHNKIDNNIDEIINLWEDFKDHERYFKFTSTQRNADTQVTKDNIGAVTQIFTPKWIAKFMVENTINYHDYKRISVLDPCLGTAQLQVEVLDLIIKKYQKDNIIIDLSVINHIYQKQLYGFDIDENVITVSKIIFLLKARYYNSDIDLTKVILPNFITIKGFKNSELIGSLFKIKNTESLDQEQKRINDCLNKTYDVVLTNPPYMGRKVLPKDLLLYLNENYPLGKSELYTSFIERCLKFLNKKGHLAMITPHTFMFIKSFKNLRYHIIKNYQIEKVLHLGKNTFENLNAYNALACSFIIKNEIPKNKSYFYKLTNYDNNLLKEEAYYNGYNEYVISQKDFLKLEDYPLIYWLTNHEIDILTKTKKLGEISTIRQGLATGNNKEFIRYWFEVDKVDINFSAENYEEFKLSNKRYALYNKGGDQTKWYTTSKTVIKFDESSYDKLLSSGNHLPSRTYYFKEGITWSLFGFNSFNVRYKEKGYVFDVSGSSLFTSKYLEKYILAFLSSNVAFYFLSSLAPTVNFQVGNIASLPLIIDDSKIGIINKKTDRLIEFAKKLDAENELSWNFEIPYIIKHYNNEKTIIDNINTYENYLSNIYYEMNLLEEKLNELFNNIYKVNIDIKIKQKNIMKSHKEYLDDLLSYLIGVVFKRYLYSDYISKIDNTKFISVKEIVQEIKKILDVKIILEIEEALGYSIESYYNNYFGKKHINKYHNLPIYWYKKINDNIYIGYYHTLKELDINKDKGIKENYKQFELLYKLKK